MGFTNRACWRQETKPWPSFYTLYTNCLSLKNERRKEWKKMIHEIMHVLVVKLSNCFIVINSRGSGKILTQQFKVKWWFSLIHYGWNCIDLSKNRVAFFRLLETSGRLIQVNNYEIVVNFFHISHNTVFQLVWNLRHGIFSENWGKSRSTNKPKGLI